MTDEQILKMLAEIDAIARDEDYELFGLPRDTEERMKMVQVVRKAIEPMESAINDVIPALNAWYAIGGSGGTQKNIKLIIQTLERAKQK